MNRGFGGKVVDKLWENGGKAVGKRGRPPRNFWRECVGVWESWVFHGDLRRFCMGFYTVIATCITDSSGSNFHISTGYIITTIKYI